MRDQPSYQSFYIPHFSFVQIYGPRIYPIEVELGQTFRRRRHRGFSSLLGLTGLFLGIGSQQ
jgi:hypothetical protein